MMNFSRQINGLIDEIEKKTGITDARVLNAFQQILRHEFIPESLFYNAYEDISLPIGYNQTISTPSIVYIMTHYLDLSGNEKILEIGTGSGYQAAILSKLSKKVFTIEINKDLYEKTRILLNVKFRLNNIRCILTDGNLGLTEEAPFDRIIVTCSAYKEAPKILLEQLNFNGKMIIPVSINNNEQNLILIEKNEKGLINTTNLGIVDFVPFLKQRSDNVFTAMA